MNQTLIIQPISPLPGATITLPENSVITLTVQITLGCGCPTCAGGRWDASRFRVNAGTSTDNKSLQSEIPLTYSGRASEFRGNLPVTGSGNYTVEITASDPETGLAGRTFINFSTI